MPDTAGFERDLYARARKGAAPDFDTIEKFFADEVDGPGAAAISGLLGSECLDVDRWQAFLNFVGAQMVRTPGAFERLQEFHDPHINEMFRRMAAFDLRFRAGVTERFQKRGANAAEIDKFFESVQNGQTTATASREFILQQAIRMIETIFTELRRMKWTFLAVRDGEPDIIIGDQPVVLTNPNEGPFGLATPGSELLLPLSPRMVACARHDGPESYGQLGLEMSELIIERTLRHANRFVFAPFDSEDLLQDMVRLNGTGPKMHTRRVNVDGKLMIAQEYRH